MALLVRQHPVREPVVALLLRLDDRRGVHARAGAERIGPEHRIVRGDRQVDGVGHQVAVLRQLRQVAPMDARQLTSPMPRSRCPCQSTLTSSPFTMLSLTNFTNAFTPSGVAWPTVSARHIRPAPQSMAARYSAVSVSGRARVVSSVTYMTGRPCRTAYVTASSVERRIRSRVQSSAYCRMGDDPMNVAASIRTPSSSEIRTIGSMSITTVRAAQLGASGSR